MRKSLSAKEVVGKTYTTIEMLAGAHGRTMSPEWQAAIGLPSVGFSMLIYGPSGNGKTTFALKLCKELNRFGQVYYNSVEQGQGLSLQQALRQCNMEECEHHPFMIGDRDNFNDMVEKLSVKRQKTRFAVIDSLQYIELTVERFKLLQQKLPHISFIIISHVTGDNQPAGAHAKTIRFMAEIKTKVLKGVAISDSRFGATIPYRVMPWENKDVDDAPKKTGKKAETGQLELMPNE
jgi:predicted ATP-dependent serine protease